MKTPVRAILVNFARNVSGTEKRLANNRGRICDNVLGGNRLRHAFAILIAVHFCFVPTVFAHAEEAREGNGISAPDKPVDEAHASETTRAEMSLNDYRELLEKPNARNPKELLPSYRVAIEAYVRPCFLPEDEGGVTPESPRGLELLYTARDHILFVRLRSEPADKNEGAPWLRLALKVEAAAQLEKDANETAKRYVKLMSGLRDRKQFTRNILEDVAQCEKNAQHLEALILFREFVAFKLKAGSDFPRNILSGETELIETALKDVEAIARGDIRPITAAEEAVDYRKALLLTWLFLDAYPNYGTPTTRARLALGRHLRELGYRKEALHHLRRVACISWEDRLYRHALGAVLSIERELQMPPEELAKLEVFRLQLLERRKRKHRFRSRASGRMGKSGKEEPQAPLPKELPTDLDEALGLLRSGEESERKRGQYALASMGVAAVPKLLEATSTNERVLRSAAWAVLHLLEGRDYALALVKAIEDERLVNVAIPRMGRLKTDEEISVVAEAAEDQGRTYQERQGLMRALSETKSKIAKQALLRLTKDRNERVRRASLHSLTYVEGDDVDRRMIQALQDPAWQVLKQAVRSLGRRKSKLGVPALCKIVSGPKKDGIAFDAVRALAKIGDPDAAPVLRKQLLVSKDAFRTAYHRERYIEKVKKALEQIKDANKAP